VTSDVRFTEGLLRQFRNRHNSATIVNMTHIKIKLFGHKDLENHTLQLCPKVMNHFVYFVCLQVEIFLSAKHFYVAQ